MYFSFYSSLLFFLIVFIAILKPPQRCQNIYLLFLCLATVSTIHHSRSYDKKTGDTIQFMDRSLVGVTVFVLWYCYYHRIELYLLGIYTAGLYFVVIPKMRTAFFKSIIHSIMHLGVLIGLCYLLLSS